MSQGVPPDFLTQVGLSLQNGAPLPSGPVMLGGGPPAPSPLVNAPPPVPSAPTAPSAPPAPALSGGMSSAGPNMSMAPPPAPSAPGPPPPPPEPTYQPPQFPLHMVGRGGTAVIPAKETDLRGPHLQAAQAERNAGMGQAIDEVSGRTDEAARREYAMYAEEARRAQLREDAAMRAQAQQQEEMRNRQADFDDTVKAMSTAANIDPNRFWANAKTETAIGAMLTLFMGGLAQGASGSANNPGLDIINKTIEQDIRAQEFQYQATKDIAGAKQTAFSMAMQKYNNADAARAAVRAAAADSLQAKLGQQAALWKSTEAQNRASMAGAALKNDRMDQAMQFFKFMPSQTVQVTPTFVDPRTGITYTNKEAQGFSKDFDAQEHDIHKQTLGTAEKLLVEGAKNQKEAQDKATQGAHQISEQLQTAGVPQARASAERAMRALNVSEGGKVEAVARWGLGPTLSRAVMSEDANAREQAYNNFMSQAMKVTYGNVTANEEVRAQASYGKTGDPAARRRSIVAVLDVLESLEKNAKAGATPEAQDQFNIQRQKAEGAPPAAPKGSKSGW